MGPAHRLVPSVDEPGGVWPARWSGRPVPRLGASAPWWLEGISALLPRAPPGLGSLQGLGCWGLRARLGRERDPKTILRPALLPRSRGRQPPTNRGAPGCLGEYRCLSRSDSGVRI